jgi:translocation and assembly module TamB
MRRAVIIASSVVGALLLLALALVVAVLIIGNTDSGRTLIARLTAQWTSGQVRLAGLNGSFPSALNLERLELADEHGVWLSAERVSLRWSPWALLERDVRIDSLTVARLHIERRPVTSSAPSKSSSFSIPHIDVTTASVDTLELGAQLAGVPASLTVQASAHLRSLDDASAKLNARRTNGEGEYALELRFDPYRMDASLNLHEPASGPLENLLNLPGLGALSANARLAGPRAGEHIELVLDAGPLHGRMRGDVNLPARSADLDYSLEAAAMTPRPGLSWERVALQGRWRGTITAPSADGKLRIDQLQLPGDTSLVALTADLAASRGALSVHAVTDGLTIPGPSPQILHAAPVTIDATVRLDDSALPVRLSASHTLFALRAQGTAAGQQKFTLDLHLPNLEPLAALGGQMVRGDANVQAQLARDTEQTRLNLDADARLAGSEAAWAKALGNNTRLKLAARLTDRMITVERLALTGRTLTLGLSGDVSRTASTAAGETVQARWDLSLTDLAALSADLAGTLKMSGRLSGPRTALSADADLTTTLSVRHSPVGTVSASLHARGLPSTPSGTLQAQGAFDGAPVLVDAALERGRGGLLHAVIRKADWKSAHIEGDVTGQADLKQGNGRVHLAMGQLADLERLLGTHLEGSVDGDLNLKTAQGRTRMELKLNARNIVTGNLTANAQLSAAGPLDGLDVRLAAQLPNLAGAPAAVTSAASLDLSGHELSLSSLEASYHDQTVKLLEPARLSFAQGLSFTTVRLGVQQAVLEVRGRISPSLNVRASLHRLSAPLINAFVPDLLDKGAIEARAHVRGSTTAPTGQVSLDIVGLRMKNDAGRVLPALDANASAQLLGDTAQIDIKATAGTSTLTATGRAPLNAAGELALKLGGKVDLALVNPLLEARGQRVAGDVSVDAEVSGAPTQPKITGSIELARGSLRDYAQGVQLSDIKAKIVGADGTLRIDSLTARAVPGTISVTGTLGVLQPGVPLDLKLTAKNAQPIESALVTARLDADLHLSGTLNQRLDLAGTVNLDHTVVGISNSLPPNVAVLDVRRPGQAARPPSASHRVIGLDVTVKSPRELLVQGRGLDAELGGELHITGTTDEPIVTGGFELQRGQFSLASSTLMFTMGEVSFNGTGLKNRIDPTLDFTAQTTVTDVTVTLHITGVADAPQFDLSSTPELPQDEILARLLFGESASQLTALQVASIGVALATLSGVGSGGGGLNPIAKVQRSLGLDRLTVSGGTSNGAPSNSTDNSGATIEAGRYVTNRVYVGARQSTTGITQLQVDVDLTKHLKLTTRLGNGTATTQGTTPENDPGSSIGLSYQFEY